MNPSVLAVNEFFVWWLMDCPGKNEWTGATYDTTINLLGNHFFSVLGDHKLQEITPQDIENWFVGLREKVGGRQV